MKTEQTETADSVRYIARDGITPVCKDVENWIDARKPGAETKKAFMEHFEGFSVERQKEIAGQIEKRKLAKFVSAMEGILKPTWWERALSWIGL